MSSTNSFQGRTLAAVADLSIDEQRYLYRKTRELKEAWRCGGDLTHFRIRDPELNVYLMFLRIPRVPRSLSATPPNFTMSGSMFSTHPSSSFKNPRVWSTR